MTKIKVGDQWLIFINHINFALVNCVHTKPNPTKEKTRNDLKLYHKSIVKIKKKHRLCAMFIKDKDKDTYTDYCRLRNQVRREARHAQKEFEKKIAASVKQQPKQLWSNAQCKTRTKSGICDLTYVEDNIKLSATTDNRNAEAHASIFSSVFTNEPSSNVTPSMPYVEAMSFCDKILFNHNAAYNKLSNLLPFKSQGPDYLHPFSLKSLCDIVCKPLAIIFQTSQDATSLRNIWKTANMSSICKNASQQYEIKKVGMKITRMIWIQHEYPISISENT